MTYPMRQRPPNRVGGGWPRPQAGRVYSGVVTRTATDAGRDMLINDPDGWEISQPGLWWVDGPGNMGPDAKPAETLWGNPPPGARGWAPGWVPPAVTRCTALICDTLAGMPWQVRQGNEQVTAPPWIADPQAKRRDRRVYGGPLPQWRFSPVEFRSASIKSALWAGESIWFTPVRNADGSPAPPIWQLNPAYIELNEAGEYQTIPTSDIAVELRDWADQAATPYVFRDDELIVTRGHLGDDLRGLSVFAHHMQELMLAGAIGGFALSSLRRGVPNGYLKVNAPNLTRPKAQELQGDWMAAHGGLDRKIAVLNATTEFHAINIDPQAMQLAQMRDYSIIDWCLVFGINPWMLGVAQRGDNTYANVESRMTEFHTLTLFPWARRFESSCDSELPSGTDMRINFGALLRPETLARYQAHRIALTEPAFLTVDEVRDIEGRAPMAEELAAEMEALAELGLPPPSYGGNQPTGTGPPLPGAVPAAAGLTTPGAAPPRPLTAAETR